MIADRLSFFRRLHGRFFGRRHLRLGIYDHAFGGTDEGFVLFLEALRHKAFHIVGDLYGFVRGLEDFLLVVFQRPHPRLDVGRVIRGVHRDTEIDREEGRGEFCAKFLLRVQLLVLPFPDKLAIHAAFMSRPVAKFMQRRRIVFVDVLICLFRQEVNDVAFRRVTGRIGIARDVVEDLRAACCEDRFADLALFLVRIALRLRLPLLERMILIDRLAVFVQEAAAVLIELVLAPDAVSSMKDNCLFLCPILIFWR